MRLPRRALDAYNAAVKQCGDGAERAAVRSLGAWLEANPNAEIADAREFCIELLRTVATAYGQGAGDAAYALRSLIADTTGIDLPSADYAYEPPAEDVDRTARYQVEKLKAGDAEGFAESIGSAARYFAERGANDTMFELTKHDERRLGRKVRFARVPTGATSCPWCLMLASRGFVYRSAKTAGESNAFHRNCDCRIVPGYGDAPGVEGYDPDRYYDMWKHPEKYAEADEEPEKPVAKAEPMTDRQKLEEEARRVYIANGGGVGLSEAEAAERFELLVDGNTDAQLRQYIRRHGK